MTHFGLKAWRMWGEIIQIISALIVVDNNKCKHHASVALLVSMAIKFGEI